MTTKEIENLPVIYEDYPPREPGDFVCTAFFHLRTTSLEKLHFHSAMEIGRCITGSGYCCINNQLQPFSAGDIHIILPYRITTSPPLKAPTACGISQALSF